MKLRNKVAILACTLLVASILPSKIFVRKNKNIGLFINGRKIDTDANPFIENERVMLPLRVIAETFGYTVMWNNSQDTVVVRNEDTEINFKTASNLAIVNSRKIKTYVPMRIKNSTTYVHIKLVSEVFGLETEWDEDACNVNLKKSDKAENSVKSDKKNESLHGEAGFEKLNSEENTNDIDVRSQLTEQHSEDEKYGKIRANADSKVYHMPGQRYYDKISADNLINFETEQDAVKAGFRKSKV